MLNYNTNVIDHSTLGTLYRLSGFNPPYRRYLVGLIGVYDVRAIVIDGAIYVTWCDIEPHTDSGADEDELADGFARRSLPICDAVGLFEEIYAARDAFIARTQSRLAVALSDWPHSAPQANPFRREVNVAAVWRDIAFVACHRASERNVSQLMTDYEAFLESCSLGNADTSGLPRFFRNLLSAAEVSGPGYNPFPNLWYGGHGFLMPGATTQTFSLAYCLLQLVRAAQGWRGDPHGSTCPGTLMAQCIKFLQPAQ